MALLQVDNLTVRFGGLRAVHDFSLKIEPGQIRGLIGPNGAGKTTVFNLITGIH
jgi:branched-chain amino acid transport system ATP-binding protein